MHLWRRDYRFGLCYYELTQKKLEEKRERSRLRDTGLEILGWGREGLNEDEGIIIKSNGYKYQYLDYNNEYELTIQNYSDYEIEKIFLTQTVHSKKDSTYLFTLKDSLVLDIDSYKGKSGRIDTYVMNLKRVSEVQYREDFMLDIKGIHKSRTY